MKMLPLYKIYPKITINGLNKEADVIYKKFIFNPLLDVYITSRSLLSDKQTKFSFINFVEGAEGEHLIDTNNCNLKEKEDLFEFLGLAFSTISIEKFGCQFSYLNNYDAIEEFFKLSFSESMFLAGVNTSKVPPIFALIKEKLLFSLTSFYDISDITYDIYDFETNMFQSNFNEFIDYLRDFFNNPDSEFNVIRNECTSISFSTYDNDVKSLNLELGKYVYDLYYKMRQLHNDMICISELNYNEYLNDLLKNLYNKTSSLYGPIHAMYFWLDDYNKKNPHFIETGIIPVKGFNDSITITGGLCTKPITTFYFPNGIH